MYKTPIFRVLLTAEDRRRAATRLTLPEMLGAAQRGILVSLQGLAAHQQARVTTELAVMLHLARRYGDPACRKGDPSAIAEAFSPVADSLRLEAPLNEPAFCQPPLIVGDGLSGMRLLSPLSVDNLFPGVQHELKGRGEGETATGEQAVYAMLSGLQRAYVKDNRSGVLHGQAVVLPVFRSGAIGEEIRALADALDTALEDAEAGGDAFLEGWAEDADIAAHFAAWRSPWDEKATAPALRRQDLAWPFLDIGRPVRLIQSGEGYSFLSVTTKADRVHADAGEMPGLPWLPTKGEDWLPNRLYTRSSRLRFTIGAVLGLNDDDLVLHAAPLTRRIPEGAVALRIMATSVETGKTTGLLDEIVPLAARDRDVLNSLPHSDRSLAETAADALALAAEVEKSALRPAIIRMHLSSSESRFPKRKGAEAIYARADRAVEAMRQWLAAELPSAVLVGVTARRDAVRWGVEDLPGAAAPAFATVEDAARRAFQDAQTELLRSRPGAGVVAANARRVFELGMRTALQLDPEEARRTQQMAPPEKAREIMQLVGRLAGAMSPPELPKVLRSASPSAPPMAYWGLIASLPREFTDDGELERALWVLIKGMALVPHPKRQETELDTVAQKNASFGRAMAAVRFHESRVERICQASGAAVAPLIEEAIRTIASSGQREMDWRQPAILMVAAVKARFGDPAWVEVLAWARRVTALDFVRERAAEAARRAA